MHNGDNTNRSFPYAEEDSARPHKYLAQLRIIVSCQEFSHMRESAKTFNRTLDPSDKSVSRHRLVLGAVRPDRLERPFCSFGPIGTSSFSWHIWRRPARAAQVVLPPRPSGRPQAACARKSGKALHPRCFSATSCL